ncbi:hypothetical protein Efla_001690 [Eimeria flavescens]
MACMPLLSEDDLCRFRTKTCKRLLSGGCDFGLARCQYSHNKQWHRRCPVYVSDHSFIRYVHLLCPKVQLLKASGSGAPGGGEAPLQCISSCERGWECPFAHSREEALYHPLVYKTAPCQRYQRGACSLYYCPYVHSESETRRPKCYRLPFTSGIDIPPIPNVVVVSHISKSPKVPFQQGGRCEGGGQMKGLAAESGSESAGGGRRRGSRKQLPAPPPAAATAAAAAAAAGRASALPAAEGRRQSQRREWKKERKRGSACSSKSRGLGSETDEPQGHLKKNSAGLSQASCLPANSTQSAATDRQQQQQQEEELAGVSGLPAAVCPFESPEASPEASPHGRDAQPPHAAAAAAAEPVEHKGILGSRPAAARSSCCSPSVAAAAKPSALQQATSHREVLRPSLSGGPPNLLCGAPEECAWGRGKSRGGAPCSTGPSPGGDTPSPLVPKASGGQGLFCCEAGTAAPPLGREAPPPPSLKERCSSTGGDGGAAESDDSTAFSYSPSLAACSSSCVPPPFPAGLLEEDGSSLSCCCECEEREEPAAGVAAGAPVCPASDEAAEEGWGFAWLERALSSLCEDWGEGHLASCQLEGGCLRFGGFDAFIELMEQRDRRQGEADRGLVQGALHHPSEQMMFKQPAGEGEEAWGPPAVYE